MRCDLRQGSEKYDIIYYDVLYNAYIKEMGLGKLYLKTLNQMKKVALLQCDYVISGDRKKLTKAEMQMQKLTNMLSKNNENGSVSIEESLVHLSKWIGSYINVKTITARDYLNMLKALDAENKKIKETKQNGKENNPK